MSRGLGVVYKRLGARSDDDQAWRDLWRKTINAEVAYANAVRVEDEAAVESSGDECVSIRLRIARTPGASPTAVAVKMAIALVCIIPLNFGDEWDQDNEDTADLENASGYDPVAEWRNTPGI
jgi:hypothetical protein